MTDIDRHRLCIAARAGLTAAQLAALARADPGLELLGRGSRSAFADLHLPDAARAWLADPDAASSASDERWRDSTGAVITEFPPGTPARKAHFPQRNRIIAGLTAGTLVVEAARRSGSLITARRAGAAGREVFAIPGSIHNPCIHGCHELIRQGAKLVERADDVLVELKISLADQLLAKTPTSANGAQQKAPALDKAYEILLDALAFEPASVDSLIERTGMNSESIASMLLILELDGHVAPHPGGRYSRMAN
jgi:DNA processing protein